MFNLFSKLVKGTESIQSREEEVIHRINIVEMEKLYNADEFVECAVMLKELLEIYGILKKKNHRTKGREFIYFILSKKHKNLKNRGYTHWEHINKIAHMKETQVYPYHKENLKNAMDFFVKELKSLKVINIKK